MKTILASAAALSLPGPAALAGGSVDPAVQPIDQVTEENHDESSAELLVPLLALGVLVAVAGSSGSTATTR